MLLARMPALWTHSKNKQGLLAGQDSPEQTKRFPIDKAIESEGLPRGPNLGMPAQSKAAQLFEAHLRRVADRITQATSGLPHPCGFQGAGGFCFCP
jgi:hypothetical protein